jgi:hypothetical protein
MLTQITLTKSGSLLWENMEMEFLRTMQDSGLSNNLKE